MSLMRVCTQVDDAESRGDMPLRPITAVEDVERSTTVAQLLEVIARQLKCRPTPLRMRLSAARPKTPIDIPGRSRLQKQPPQSYPTDEDQVRLAHPTLLSHAILNHHECCVLHARSNSTRLPQSKLSIYSTIWTDSSSQPTIPTNTGANADVSICQLTTRGRVPLNT